MNSPTENKELISEENLPRTEDPPQKVVQGRILGLKKGALVAGGALVGCFALALWNRKTLSTLARNRGQRKDPSEENSADETDAIY